MLESAGELHRAEWAFNKRGTSGSPQLGIALSGGGNRSAVFSVGVLTALHERQVLDRVDVISAVSGGSYALSWLLLQPYYAAQLGESPCDTLARMFDREGVFQRYLEHNTRGMAGVKSPMLQSLAMLPATLYDAAVFNLLRPLLAVLGSRSDFANTRNASNSSRRRYREAIQKTYHVLPDENGAPRNRRELSFKESVAEVADFLDLTRNLPPVTFPGLAAFAAQAGLPAFVFNATVSPPKAAKRDEPNAPLRDRAFELATGGFGSDSCGYLSWDDTEGAGAEPGKTRFSLANRQRPSPYATVRNLNVAPAISGAAFSAATYEKSALARWAVRLLNVGLEYRVPNPSRPEHIVRLGDGGHSDNLGAFALLRRNCASMLIVDAEYDPDYEFGAYHNIRAAARGEPGCDLAVDAIDKGTFSPADPVMRGRAGGHEVYYLKLSLDETRLREMPASIRKYHEAHPRFPQESTRDQFFESEQFRAYRDLGYHLAMTSPTLARFGRG